MRKKILLVTAAVTISFVQIANAQIVDAFNGGGGVPGIVRALTEPKQIETFVVVPMNKIAEQDARAFTPTDKPPEPAKKHRHKKRTHVQLPASEIPIDYE